MPGMEVSFAIAVVTLDEQDDLPLMTNIVYTPHDAEDIGMRGNEVFESCEDDIYLPLFEPLEASS